ncbi:MAG: cyclic nucleotide-binding domain-containing protein [Acidimicrobiia bacterium]|nr:cyclic nucleotide-binding domain-containing protein [Acidimicrobiia bacterium]MBV9040967.1 cyclic nucleotide-binding domain-containing protein [Acidimicrobiia bacterium]
MRIESSITSVSWIPSEAIKGMTKMPFEVGGLAHYDKPLPDVIDVNDLEKMRDNDQFRFANHLRAWIRVEDGRIIDHGQSGGTVLNCTHMKLGPKEIVFQATAFPEIRPKPKVTKTSATFVQTCGGRPGMPAPRRVKRKPYIQLRPPTVWTTLQLTLHADGRVEQEMTGATPFPRHWVYDGEGKLIAKSGMIDFKEWWTKVFGKKHTPWGNEDSAAFVTTVETALERQLSGTIMRAGKKPRIRKIKEGGTLVEQGEKGEELFLLLDGVLAAEYNGEKVNELGPGAILGERAILEGGTRTLTLRALTPVKVAVAPADQVDKKALTEVAVGHRKEDGR